MRGPLFGIPACGEPVWLRFGEFYRVADDGRVLEARVLLGRSGPSWQAPSDAALAGRQTAARRVARGT
jgi:hypothetical protein